MKTRRIHFAVLALAVIFAAVTAFSAGKSSANTRGETWKSEKRTAEREIEGILEDYYRIARRNDPAELEKFSRQLSAEGYRYTNEFGSFEKNQVFALTEKSKPEFESAGFENLEVKF